MIKRKRTYPIKGILKPFNLGLQLNYFMNKSRLLELKLETSKLEYSELENKFIRMKLEENK
jgi:hypothetical protein